MKLDRLRFMRQMRLPEVGEAGQARLSSTILPLTTEGFAAEVEARYLRGAGAAVQLGAPPLRRIGGNVPELGLDDAAAREVAEGALAALVALRAVLMPEGDAS